MTTEAKICEAFEKYLGGYIPEDQEVAYLDFKAGYMALLNELEKTSITTSDKRGEFRTVFHLPEGVEKP